ncbi:hypothetical protein G9464_01780 [Halostella sp. JP-L12]|uniref:hypothetical protein n=1 Tax=Halostella TaxID=1843185 RepID=UPI000EF7A823|nr:MULTISPECIES: hypothetical protein [Halostella]NHN46330.1 hypothetical protein [Halostella sp. JP-L12]
MERRTRNALESAGVLMASLTGGLHLMIGIERLTFYLMAARPFTDVRQPLFVLSGVAIFLGITLWYRGLRRDVVYGAGILLMLGYVVGWLLLGGHGSNYAWEAGGHHAASPLVTLIDHLTGDIYLFATKVTETALLGILSVLLYDELTRDDADEDGDDADADDANPT